MFSLRNIPAKYFCTLLLIHCFCSGKLCGADRYWDSDGNTSGLGNSNGSWSSGGVWSSTTGGTDAKSWVNGSTAIFSDGSPTITADVAGAATLDGITILGSNSNITIADAGESLALDGFSTFNIADGSNLSVNTILDYQGTGVLTKTGKGVLSFGVNNSGSGPGINETYIAQGKIDLGSSVTDWYGGILGGDIGKTMVGGLGTIDDTLTVGSDNGEIDFISPGLGSASSFSSASSLKQSPSGRSSGAIGKFTTTTLNWNGGGVYDWEIKTFTADNSANHTKFDVLSVGTINFNDKASDAYTVNIMSVSNDAGAVGAVTNPDQTWQDHLGTNGFKFLTASTVSGMTETGNNVSDFFNIRADDFYYTNNNWYGTWDVYRSGNDFYLTYSVAPEPSTYVMISALFLFIGGNRSSRKSIRSIFSILKNKFVKKDNSQTTAVSS